MRHKKKRQKAQRSIVQFMDERVKNCAGYHLPMSFGAGFNQFEAPL